MGILLLAWYYYLLLIYDEFTFNLYFLPNDLFDPFGNFRNRLD